MGALEKHYTVEEIAEAWSVSPATVRRIFRDEPGVVVLAVETKPGRRPYRTLRVPHSVLQRVHSAAQRA
jgi:predicted transcriptional regulator